MPAPHSRGKSSRKARKGKAPQRERTRTTPAAAKQPATTQPITTTAPTPAIPRPAAGPRAAAKAVPARQYAIPEYPYVSGELVRIGVLAIILVVVLIVLSQVLS
jgi:hypothetical protein